MHPSSGGGERRCYPVDYGAVGLANRPGAWRDPSELATPISRRKLSPVDGRGKTNAPQLAGGERLCYPVVYGAVAIANRPGAWRDPSH